MTILKANYHLFSRMLIIAGNRNLDIEQVLQYPLGPLPWSLANCDGSMKKTNKATLARCLEKKVSAEEQVTQPSAAVIDGMSVVQKLKGDNHTFDEISNELLNIALQSNPCGTRVDVVFGSYRNISINKQKYCKGN